MIITTYFSDGWTPKTGLTPTIKIYNITDSTLEINWDSMVELWDWLYKYDFTWYTNTRDYAFRADWGSWLSDSERYTTWGNEDFSFATLNALPEAFTPWTVWSNMNFPTWLIWNRFNSALWNLNLLTAKEIWNFKVKWKSIIEILTEEDDLEDEDIEDLKDSLDEDKLKKLEDKIEELTKKISEKKQEVDIGKEVIQALDNRNEKIKLDKKKQEVKNLLLEKQKESIIEAEKEQENLEKEREKIKKLLLEKQKQMLEEDIEEDEEEEDIELQKERVKKLLLEKQKILLNNL